MSKKTPRPANNQWFPVSTLARVIGTSPPNFRLSILPLLPPEAIRPGKPMLIRGPAVIEAILDREIGRRGTGEPDSGALEELRRIECKRRQLKYEREAEQMVYLADVERGFMMIAEVFRRTGEAVRAEYGDGAAQLLHNCWEDVRHRIDELFSVKVD